jgi:hypothetical protein
LNIQIFQSMIQVTVNIPESAYPNFLEYVATINNASLQNESTFELSLEQKERLIKSSLAPLEDCIPYSTFMDNLKNRNGL